MSPDPRSIPAVLLSLLIALGQARAQEPLLLLGGQTPGNLAMVSVDLSHTLGRDAVNLSGLSKVQAIDDETGNSIAVQYVPAPPNAEEQKRATGTLILQLPQPGVTAVRLAFEQAESAAKTFDPTAPLSTAEVTHDASLQAGLPHKVLFRKTGTKFQEFNWNDRLYNQELGGFLLRHDKQARLSIVSDGPICRVYRVEASYKRADGTAPKTNPRAVYDWHYFHDQPVVYVTATISQDEAFAWNEAHFLELNFPGHDFTRWAGGSSRQTGELLGNSSSHRMSDWAAVMSERDAIAMFDCGRVLVHDGRGKYGTYLHAAGDRSWEKWQDTHRQFSGWLWLGDAADASDAIDSWRQQIPRMIRGALTDTQTHEAIEEARRKALQTASTNRRHFVWQVAMADRLETEGQPEAALNMLKGRIPRNLTLIHTSDIWFTVRERSGGIEVISLLDTARPHEHLARQQPPLFEIILRNHETSEDVTLFADQGWQTTSAVQSGWGPGYLRWSTPANPSIGDLKVEARALPDGRYSALYWQFTVSKPEPPWSVWQVRFPQLALASPGKQSVLFFPRGPGEISTKAWTSAFSFGGTYPSGWLSMQFLASYDPETRQGLYWGLHDPLGSTKDIVARSRQPSGSVLLSSTHPAPDMGQPANGFELSGEAVWQLLRGDWYDAARIYRQWAQEHARWYPQLGGDGREDTPLWMRELCAWAQTGGTADQCVDQVQRFAEFLDVPVGFHWYRWHKIPFDNDYPHYFPATDGFVDGAEKLQAANVFVMPYINGRLWDTRDRGGEDYLFTKQALPAVTKDEQGKPFTETYGSKEDDGSRVTLGVMCPTTTTWQNKLREINRRLFTECGVDGVYIDQVAAAAPKTCMDTSHGHPIGGGHWWNEGYWRMLELIRQDMRPEQILTTECNAEPFLRWFDGYLTWHWQYDGQVPAFPAVYGGAIQMFGRAYRGGDTQDLALRMKAAQQLTYGEQIGWLGPNVINQKENAEFLRDVVRMRYRLRRYFYAGEMLRPPKLTGDIPRVRADWQWSGQWWVETDAVLTGAWLLRAEQRAVVIFANVSDQAIQAHWAWDASANGIEEGDVGLKRIKFDADEGVEVLPQLMTKDLSLPPRTIVAFEIEPAEGEGTEK